MKNPLRYHTHKESDNVTLAVFFVLALALAAVALFGVAHGSKPVMMVGAIGCLVTGSAFKLELAAF